MTESIPTFETARATVLRTRNPSIAALQAALHLGHSEASALIAALQEENVLLGPWPGRGPGLHPDHQRVHVQPIVGDQRLEYIERVAQLALFYFELAEEDSDAHSDALRAQLPVPALDWKTVQGQFRREWYGARRLALSDAAVAFHHWLKEKLVPQAELPGVEAAIRARCLPYERPFRPVHDGAQRLARGYVRMARFFRRMHREQITGHSRVAQWFIPDALAPQNTALPGQHPEHVVPCAVLRGLAIARYEDQWSVHQVAALLRKLLVVIWIDQRDRCLLDDGRDSLRSRMPRGWQLGSGCLYARLHEKGIVFEAAPGYPCGCAEQG